MRLWIRIRKLPRRSRRGSSLRRNWTLGGWLQADLADILGIQPSVISALVKGRKTVTPEIAKSLAAAFGTTPQLWMNLESSYRLFITEINGDRISRKAKLYASAPVKELVKRSWVEPSDNLDVFEKRLCVFFQADSLDDLPDFAHAAKKASAYGVTTQEQEAWLCRARHLARAMHLEVSFSKARFGRALKELRNLLAHEEEVRRIPRVLADAGIRFLIVEHLPTTRIDGATFWLDSRSPAIVLSMRFDRLDWFWQTLIHEMRHVERRDGVSEATLDSDIMENSDKPQEERQIDAFAADLLIANDDMADFVARVSPLFSKTRIKGFASRLKIHPAIVVGQLQFKGQIPYSHSRDLLVKVRHILTQSALTDGWGCLPSVAV